MAKDVKFDIKAQNKTDQAFNAVERNLKSITGGLGGMKTAMLGIGAAIGGFYTLQKAVGAVTSAAMTQVQAETNLKSVLESTGHAAGFSFEELKKMAAGLQDVTTFGDETILMNMAMLATFKNIQGEGFERTTKAALDLSTIMQGDLKSATVMLGKALNDPIANLGALSKAGVQFSESQTEAIKSMAEMGNMAGAQNLILQELESQFGGAATAAAGTFGGALDQMKNALSDVLETVGFGIVKNDAFIEILKEMKNLIQNDLAPVVEGLVMDFVEWIGPADQLRARFQSFMSTVSAMIRPLQTMYSLLKAVFNYVGKGMGTLAGGVSMIGEKFGAGDISGGFKEVGTMAGTLGGQAGDFIKDVTGSFQSGTGPGGLPRDGLFYGHAGKVVHTPEESRALRKGGGGNLTININTHFMSGDRNAARSVAREISQALKEYNSGLGNLSPA